MSKEWTEESKRWKKYWILTLMTHKTSFWSHHNTEIHKWCTDPLKDEKEDVEQSKEEKRKLVFSFSMISSFFQHFARLTRKQKYEL